MGSFNVLRRLLSFFRPDGSDSVTPPPDERLRDITMDQECSQTLKALQHFRLTHAEKDRMLSAILDTPPHPTVFDLLKRIAALSLALILLVGSSASYAATSALPGDMLYPVKVHVNERIRGMLTRSPDGRARFAVRLAARRLEEMETLTARGRTSAELRDTVRERFRGHAQEVALELDTLLALKDMEAVLSLSTDFEASLRAHEAVIARIERLGGRVAATSSLLLDVRDFLRATKEARAIAQARGRMIAQEQLASAARATMDAANRKIQIARATLRERRSKHPRLAEEADIKLTAAQQHLELAEEAMVDPAALPETLETISSALSQAEEVTLLLKHADGIQGIEVIVSPDGPLPAGDAGLRQRAAARIDVAGKRIADTRKLLTKQEERLTAEELKRAKSALTFAEEALAESQTALDARAYADALIHADTAIAHAKRARKIIRREPLEEEKTSTSTGASGELEDTVDGEGAVEITVP